MPLRATLTRLAKEIQLRSPLRRYFFHRYQYMFTPAQLAFLCDCVTRTCELPGAIVEVGCAAGCTTVFLNKHLDALGIEKPYVAVDTFEGFTEADVNLEIAARGKSAEMFQAFRVNSRRWFEFTLALNHIRRVNVVQADANTFDFSRVGPIAFCLIDVDLYRPVRTVLQAVFDRLPEGGIIVVDDCTTASAGFDGALQAYQEFIRQRALPECIVLGKLGVISRGEVRIGTSVVTGTAELSRGVSAAE